MIYDQTRCTLGEGPLWHPDRKELFWFDIGQKALHSKAQNWRFRGHVSAAGWIDCDTLLIASETALLSFDIPSGEHTLLCQLDANNPVTRSNDGRTDPWGGFWIGTMGKNAEANAGAIYRYYRGELRRLYAPLTIPNAICFSPDAGHGYFADTVQRKIWRQALSQTDGWPTGAPEVFVDLGKDGLNPDGAVCDTAGNLWNAQWGAARVACYRPDGQFDHAIALPTDHITCPAFGGSDLRTLFVTSATQDLAGTQIDAGKTFALEVETPGQKEHQVVL